METEEIAEEVDPWVVCPLLLATSVEDSTLENVGALEGLFFITVVNLGISSGIVQQGGILKGLRCRDKATQVKILFRLVEEEVEEEEVKWVLLHQQDPLGKL